MKAAGVNLVLPVLLVFIGATSIYGASYTVYEGADGEVKENDRPKWVEVCSFKVKGGKLYIIDNNGDKRVITKTGTYRLNNGRIYVIKNGKIIKAKRGKPRMLPGLR